MSYGSSTASLTLEERKEIQTEIDRIHPKNMSIVLHDDFNSLLLGQCINLSHHDFVDILRDLGVREMCEAKVRPLFGVFKYYRMNWPEWDEVRKINRLFRNRNVQLTDDAGAEICVHKLSSSKEAWFKEFCAYLRCKMNAAVALQDAMLLEEWSSRFDANTQTDSFDVADYCIRISGPPKVVGNLEFTVEGDDVVLASKLNDTWDGYKLNLKQLLNYPQVSVSLNIGEVVFTRTCKFDVQAQLSTDSEPFRVQLERIDSSAILDDKVESKVYTKRLVEMYVKQLEAVVDGLRGVPEVRKVEVVSVLHELVSDIDDISPAKKLLPSNFIVSCRAGNSTYMRCSESNNLAFCQVLTPKLTLAVRSFAVEQDVKDKSRVSFVPVNKYKQNGELLKEILNGECVTYACETCKVLFASYKDIWGHLVAEHCPEQAVACVACNEYLQVNELSASRWKHCCKF